MKLLRLIIINIKRQIKNPMLIFSSVIFPIILLGVLNSGGGGMNTINIGVIDNDKSKESEEVVKRIEERYNIKKDLSDSIEDNKDLVEKGDVAAIYIIDESFDESLKKGEAPKIEAYKKSSGGTTLNIDNIINSFVQENLKSKESNKLEETYLKTELLVNDAMGENKSNTAVVMVCYFMLIAGSTIVEDIIKFKKENVLKRTMATPNTDVEIIGSIFLSSFILQSVLGIISIKAIEIILKLEFESFGIVALVIILGSLISTAMILAVIRWFKNEGIATLVLVLSGLILFTIGNLGNVIGMIENPPAILKLGIISPFMWLLKILETGEIIVPTIIILLMSGVLFTLGSFKIREFIKN
ncbi:MAG: ABC transporter permease [Clostridium sp.]